MKVVILAGGFGTRISEESHLKPKPMIEIGEKPILWHIMKYYSQFGYNEFIICLGYKQYVVKEFFADYFLHTSDVTFDLANNSMKVHNNYSEPWKVTLIDTGLNTMTGGRVKRIRAYVGDEPFMLTYGDGLANIDLKALEEFHRSHGKIGHHHRCQHRTEIRRPGYGRGRQYPCLPREKRRRRQPYQRRLHGNESERVRLHRGRRHGI